MKKQKDWKYEEKMEDMKDRQLMERIQNAMDYEIKNKIRQMPYLGGLDGITQYKTKELVAKCPVTGIMDLYTINIEIIPDKWIPELKSLKYYFMA